MTVETVISPPMSFPRNKSLHIAALLLAAFSILWLLRAANAFEQLSFTIQKLESDSWRAEQLHFSLDWPSLDSAAYRLEIGRLELFEPKQILSDIRLDCLKGTLSDQQISCMQGQAHLPWDGLDNPAVELSFTFQQASGSLEGRLQELYIAGGRATVDFSIHEDQWEAKVLGRRLNLQSLLALLPIDLKVLEGWSYSGDMRVEAHFSGRQGKLIRSNWKANISHLAFSDAMGETAGEGLGARLQGRLKHSSDRWQIRSELSLQKGEMLTPLFYLNPTNYPLKLEARIILDEQFQKIQVENARLDLQGLLTLSATADLDLSNSQQIQKLSLKAKPFQLAELYGELLQPVLFGTPWGSLELAGRTELALELDGELMSLDLGLDDFHLDDADASGRTRRMGLYDVSGRLHWKQGGESQPSWLSWQSGHLLEQLDLGAGRIEFQAQDRDFSLIRQVTVPVVDGALVVDRLNIQNLGSLEQKIQFDGMIEPISMHALSEALGWLPLSGKLSGVIPGLTYKHGQFNIDGVLLVRMFDGEILIRELQLQDLFGVYPQLQADIALQSLDLETLTSTFSFGKITGRLDGYVRGLSLEAWQPVAFDARFYTPKDDKSRRRISQKAVDNISNLGGAGLSGSLARSFLGMFEEFRYKRIGIGCRLRDETCEMVGVGEANQGYYLVEGSGIPRIDIIGYNRTADWTRLVEQLKQISESGSPVIQ
ncbi:MAG: hypothetical protein ABFS39_04080 [Pseudomonadota bacterium]